MADNQEIKAYEAIADDLRSTISDLTAQVTELRNKKAQISSDIESVIKNERIRLEIEFEGKLKAKKDYLNELESDLNKKIGNLKAQEQIIDNRDIESRQIKKELEKQRAEVEGLRVQAQEAINKAIDREKSLTVSIDRDRQYIDSVMQNQAKLAQSLESRKVSLDSKEIQLSDKEEQLINKESALNSESARLIDLQKSLDLMKHELDMRDFDLIAKADELAKREQDIDLWIKSANEKDREQQEIETDLKIKAGLVENQSKLSAKKQEELREFELSLNERAKAIELEKRSVDAKIQTLNKLRAGNA